LFEALPHERGDMRKELFLALGLLVVASTASAGSIYKCTTSEGVVFSQSPCAPDAVKLKSGKKKSARQSVDGQEGGSAGALDIKLIDEIGAETATVIVETIGQPAARYTHDGTEHWLYPNAVKVSDDRRVSPELLLENGRHYQTSWIPEDVMKRSVQVARGLADWDQPDSTSEKSFSVGDTVVMGQSKSQVVGKLGQPDAKRVFDGREVWEYRDVQFAASNPQTLTIYLTFDGDIVASSAGN
jgi:hypothetical protein